MKMAWFGKAQEMRNALQAQEARIAALEEQGARLADALREVREAAEDQSRGLGEVAEAARCLADRVAEQLDAVPGRIEDQRGALNGLRNDLVKLRAEMNRGAIEAETQTRALFSRIEAIRTR